MSSDIILDDEQQIRLIAPKIRFEGYKILGEFLPVQISGPVQFRDKLLVGLARKQAAPPSATWSHFASPAAWTSLADEISEVTAVTAAASLTSAVARLRAMQPPYDVLEMLVALRDAVLAMSVEG